MSRGNNPDQPGRLIQWLYPRCQCTPGWSRLCTHWFEGTLEGANRIFAMSTGVRIGARIKLKTQARAFARASDQPTGEERQQAVSPAVYDRSRPHRCHSHNRISPCRRQSLSPATASARLRMSKVKAPDATSTTAVPRTAIPANSSSPKKTSNQAMPAAIEFNKMGCSPCRTGARVQNSADSAPFQPI